MEKLSSYHKQLIKDWIEVQPTVTKPNIVKIVCPELFQEMLNYKPDYMDKITSEKIISGEEMRDIVTKVGLDRCGYDGINMYMYLKDGSTIQIEANITTDEIGQLKFTFVTFSTDKA